MLQALALLALSACVAVDYIDDHGSVYECDTPRGAVELCTDLDRSELANEVGGVCRLTSRAWPRAVGCVYRCPPPAHGCNALNGCWCP